MGLMLVGKVVYWNTRLNLIVHNFVLQTSDFVLVALLSVIYFGPKLSAWAILVGDFSESGLFS